MAERMEAKSKLAKRVNLVEALGCLRGSLDSFTSAVHCVITYAPAHQYYEPDEVKAFTDMCPVVIDLLAKLKTFAATVSNRNIELIEELNKAATSIKPVDVTPSQN